MNKGNNSSKITISLKKDEREALAEEAERRGVKVPTLAADLVRKHIKRRYSITERQTRPADNHRKPKSQAKKATEK